MLSEIVNCPSPVVRNRQSSIVNSFSVLFLLVFTGGMLTASSLASELPAWSLLSSTQVDGSGIHLDQLIKTTPPAVLPHLRLAPAPLLGQTVSFTRAQILQLLEKTPGIASTNWTGSAQIAITRRSRELSETELMELLQAALKKDLNEKGALEFRPSRPWTPILIPDESIKIKFYDLPNAGIAASLLLHFDLSTATERIGSWQIPVQASLWRDVLIARAPLRRGTLLREAELAAERRDVLAIREPINPEALNNPALEITENLQPGAPLLARSVRLRPVIRRGNVVDAVLQQGALQISLKVQVLEDGFAGQVVRVRNIKSKHEFFGKVQNENTIAVLL